MQSLYAIKSNPKGVKILGPHSNFLHILLIQYSRIAEEIADLLLFSDNSAYFIDFTTKF